MILKEKANHEYERDKALYIMEITQYSARKFEQALFEEAKKHYDYSSDKITELEEKANNHARFIQRIEHDITRFEEKQ